MSAEINMLRQVPLAALVLSSTTAQKERRAHLDKDELKELAASIKAAGVLQPILVRPAPIIQSVGLNGATIAGKTYFAPSEIEEAARTHWEVVAGERRVLAAREAGLEEIPANIREFTDEQVTELQLIENLQRQDLHELAEAEGYEQLLKYGHSADDIAAKVGKSRGTVYARMKLLALCTDARHAYYAGKLTASVALLLARIPVPELQQKALKEVLEEGDSWGDDPRMSYREAADHIQRRYMLRLKEAPFPIGDESLVRHVGSCLRCPKNTGCSDPRVGNLELFADVKDARAGVCTDPHCFREKREAWGVRQLAEAESRGQQIIQGDEAAHITKNGAHTLSGGYVNLDDRCHNDEKGRTYRQLIGKSAKPALLVVPIEKQNDDDAGEEVVLEVVKKADVTELLAKKGVAAPAEPRYSNPDRAREKKAKVEREFRRALYELVREKLPDRVDLKLLRLIAAGYVGEMQSESVKAIVRLWEWESDAKGSYPDWREIVERHIATLNQDQLVTLLQDFIYVPELQVSPWSDAKPERLLEAAKALRIDVAKVRRECAGLEQLQKLKKLSKQLHGCKNPKRATPVRAKGKR
jgi:ParB/RepB/Spo0J family partition protein